MNITDENTIQSLSVGINTNPSISAILKISQNGRLQAKQIIKTHSIYIPEIQAIYIKSPFSTINSIYFVIHELFVSDLSSIITITASEYNNKNTIISSSKALTYSSLISIFPFALNCNISIITTIEGRYYTITYAEPYTNSLPSLPNYVPNLQIHVSSGKSYFKVLSKGGVTAIQQVNFTTNNNIGYLKLNMNGYTTEKIFINASASDIQTSLGLINDIGKVLVHITTYPTNYLSPSTKILTSWTINFLQKFGAIPLLGVTLYGEAVSGGMYDVRTMRDNTCVPVGGNYTLSLYNHTSVGLTTLDSANTIQFALNNMSSISNIGKVEVFKYVTINNGVMLLIKVINNTDGGNIPLFLLNSNNLYGTELYTNVDRYQDGNNIGGSFIITTNSNLNGNLFGSSTVLNYDATANDVKNALESLNSSFIPLTVTRNNR